MSERPLEPRAQARRQAHDARRRARSSRSSSRSSTCTRSRTVPLARAARAERPRRRPAAARRAARRRPLRAQPRDRRLHPDRRGDERHGRRRAWCCESVVTRAAPPTRTATSTVIDSRAPRFNQAVIGVAVAARGRHRLVVAARAARAPARARADARPALVPAVPRLLRADPAALRRRPARGLPPAAGREHGRLRRARRRLGRLRGRADRRSASRSALLVAALALLAAVTGFCTGCEAYKLGCRLTGRPVRLLPASARGPA